MISMKSSRSGRRKPRSQVISGRKVPSAPKRPERLRTLPTPASQNATLTKQQRGELSEKRNVLHRNIRDAFEQFERKKSPLQIKHFIERAEGFAPIYEYLTEPTSVSTKEIQNRLMAAQKAAASLLSALADLGAGGEVFNQLICSGRSLGKWANADAQHDPQPEGTHEGQMQRLASESAELGHRYELALAWGGQELMLRRLWAYCRALQLQSHHARQSLTPSRGNRVSEQHALILANYLYESWMLAFNERPSARRDGDFHEIAKTVGESYGITIGGKILKAIRLPD
ncbi:MAG: hypothetical protein M3N97_14890 [Pseudomonadota bacterium]|nr:hypothetical protein [Pseudomonadota bacterium]